MNVRIFKCAGLALILLLMAAPGLQAQSGEEVVRANVIIYPWLPPTHLPSAMVDEEGEADPYKPVAIDMYYGASGDYHAVNVRENKLSGWFAYRGPRRFYFYGSKPVADEAPPPALAQVTLPAGAENILLIMAPDASGGYRLLPIALGPEDFQVGRIKVVNLGSNEVVGLIGKSKLRLPAGQARNYEFPGDKSSVRVSFAYHDTAEWLPFFDSYVARSRGAIGMLFIHPMDQGENRSYGMRRISVPKPTLTAGLDQPE